GYPAPNATPMESETAPEEHREAPVEAESYNRRRAFQPAAVAPEMPHEDTYSSGRHRYDVMRTRNFIGTLILMSVPVLGWIYCIACALSSTVNKNKRNLARAYLILMAAAALLCVVVYLAFESEIKTLWAKFWEYLSRQMLS
ncbi:MAG TPA: hypothetical protein DEQ02_01850, partial [Ruminococcaceae bacterium]|nr:hypothetical protein [Oscillospiraceae bacterium]